MHAHELFDAHLPLIDTIIGRVCRRSRLFGAAAEDFASEVKIALLEEDCALLRNAAGRASIGAYLTVVIQRMAVDERIRELGRFQSSSAAKRFGEVGVAAEILMRRDRRTIGEALSLLRALDPELTGERLAEITSCLPERFGRPRAVDLGDEGFNSIAAPERADGRAIEAEETRTVTRMNRVVRNALESFSLEDRMLIRCRFGSAMSIADISRILRLPQRPLYRRLESLLVRLRKLLGDAGVDSTAALEVIGSRVAEMRFGLGDGKTEEFQQSDSEEGP
ncbi:MAG: sigma-70 family RNA polymerase sigma factor [Acidobacteriota bacterium]